MPSPDHGRDAGGDHASSTRHGAFGPGGFPRSVSQRGAGIFIDTVARLGHSAGIIGGVGRDDFGACILTRLKGHGVEVRWVLEVPDRSTAVAFVTYFADGSRKFIYHIDGTPAVMADFPVEAAREAPNFFHVMGCSLMANDRFRALDLRRGERPAPERNKDLL